MSLYSGTVTAGEVVALPQALLDVYSLEIEHNAMPIMRFEEFAEKKTDLEKEVGERVIFTTYNNLERGGQLLEHENLSEKNMSASQKGITVTEYGNAVGVREKLIQLSYDDALKEAALLLGRDYAVVNDMMCRDALYQDTNIYYCGGRATRALMQGAVDYMDIESVRIAVELLQTNNAPKYMSDYYACFCAPHQVAYIKRDPDWIAANNYANTRALFTGELGRWEDVIFIGTTMAPNGAAATSDPGYEAALKDAATAGIANADVYRAVICGENAFGRASALPVEMRDNGVQDYGRKHGLAWYAIMGAKLLEENNAVIIESV